MSAERLREAAALLRERAEAATPGPWHVDPETHRFATIEGPHVRHSAPNYTTAVITHGWDSNVEYIATMHPGVGLALADWLDSIAEWIEGRPFSTPTNSHALAVADQILGGAS